MAINSDQMTGFVVGLGAAALGFYLYKKNQARVDGWLRQQGIHVPQPGAKDASSLTIEELMTEKERLEDLIAERQMAPAKEGSAPAEPS